MEERNPSPGAHVDARGIKPAPAFQVQAQDGPARTRVLRLIGEFDLAASDLVREHFDAALAAEPNVVLDMEETQFIDSSMLKQLLRANAAAAKAGGRLVLTAVQPPVRRLLDLTGVAGLLAIEPSRDAGLKRVSSDAPG